MLHNAKIRHLSEHGICFGGMNKHRREMGPGKLILAFTARAILELGSEVRHPRHSGFKGFCVLWKAASREVGGGEACT